MIITTLLRKIAEWRRFRSNVRELSRLDDRELNDIGISRADIERCSWEAARAA